MSDSSRPSKATPHHHIVTSFEKDLEGLAALIAKMGGLAEEQLSAVLAAVQTRDHKAARKVIAGDDALDTMDIEVSKRALRLLALRQPMAGDLRETIAALKISTDIERIGDLAENIAHLILREESAVSPHPLLGGVARMGKRAMTQVKNAMDAYSERDALKARAVCQADDDLDEIYVSTFRATITYMLEDPRQMTTCLPLLFVAKHIERVGDHATNIAESVIFATTGKSVASERHKAGKKK